MGKKRSSKNRKEEALIFKPESVFKAYELYNSDIIIDVPPSKPLYNFERLDKFLENVKNKKIDSIRVIHYDIEANMGVISFFYDGNDIIVIFDWSRDHTGGPRIEMHTGKNIIKEENINGTEYYLETPEMKYLSLFFLRSKHKYKINE